MKCAATWFIVTAATALSSCSASMPPSPVPNRVRPLIEVSCPPLTPLTDPSFGATTLKLIEVAGLYRECRAAALAMP